MVVSFENFTIIYKENDLQFKRRSFFYNSKGMKFMCLRFCFLHQEFKEGSKKSRDNLAANLILNHDFSNGLDSWHPNCCEGYVASNSGYPQNISASPGNYYAVITNRKECWQGLEQDITTRVSPGLTYTVSATVSVSGPLQDIADVSATLRLEYRNAATSYLFIARYLRFFPCGCVHSLYKNNLY